MGLIRVLLAVTVVLVHARYPSFVGGRFAVQLFYVISGFLISYILVERRSYATRRAFYANRFLRLWPAYAVVAALTAIAYSLASIPAGAQWFDVFARAPLAADILVGVSNLTILMQDWVMFFAVEQGEMVPTTNFLVSDPPLYQGLLVPQAWTLGVEISFYLVAPFILGSRLLMGVLLTASVLLRIVLIQAGFGWQDPWTYRFFPTELALFLSGALAHQLGLPVFRRLSARYRHIDLWCVAAIILVVMAFQRLPLPYEVKVALLFTVFIALLPGCFLFQNRHRLDKWVGELSYPIYICHLLVINILMLAPSLFGERGGMRFAFESVALSLAMAFVLMRFVAQPFEALRGKVRTPSARVSALA